VFGYQTVVTTIVDGTCDSISDATKEEIRNTFAAAAQVAIDRVNVTAVCGSVVLIVTIDAWTENEQARIQGEIKPRLWTTAAATELIQLSVLSVPIIANNSVPIVYEAPPYPPQLPPSSPPPPGPYADSITRSAAVTIAAGDGGLGLVNLVAILVFLLLLIYCACKCADKHGKLQPFWEIVPLEVQCVFHYLCCCCCDPTKVNVFGYLLALVAFVGAAGIVIGVLAGIVAGEIADTNVGVIVGVIAAIVVGIITIIVRRKLLSKCYACCASCCVWCFAPLPVAAKPASKILHPFSPPPKPPPVVPEPQVAQFPLKILHLMVPPPSPPPPGQYRPGAGDHAPATFSALVESAGQVDVSLAKSIRNLHGMLIAGFISEAEFESRKTAILNKAMAYLARTPAPAERHPRPPPSLPGDRGGRGPRAARAVHTTEPPPQNVHRQPPKPPVPDSMMAPSKAYEPTAAPEAYEPAAAPEAYEPTAAPEAYEPAAAPEAYEPTAAPEACEPTVAPSSPEACEPAAAPEVCEPTVALSPPEAREPAAAPEACEPTVALSPEAASPGSAPFVASPAHTLLLSLGVPTARYPPILRWED